MSSSPQVVVVGSIMQDLTFACAAFPRAGDAVAPRYHGVIQRHAPPFGGGTHAIIVWRDGGSTGARPGRVLGRTAPNPASA